MPESGKNSQVSVLHLYGPVLAMALKKNMSPGIQLLNLFILAIPVACNAWTITPLKKYSERAREFCQRKSESAKKMLIRKFFYLFAKNIVSVIM